MTDEMTSLRALVEETLDADLRRENERLRRRAADGAGGAWPRPGNLISPANASHHRLAATLLHHARVDIS